VMATNVTGTANVARAALRQFRSQQSGHLVLIGSLLGKIAVPSWVPTSPASGRSTGSPGSCSGGPVVARRRGQHGVAGQREHPGVYAGGKLRRPGRTPASPIDQPDKIARAVVRTVDRPRRERSVGLMNHPRCSDFEPCPPSTTGSSPR
jgi:hypothetical protein